MAKEIIKDITIKQLKEADLCFTDFSEEHLYDSYTIEEFYESVVSDLSQETDITEFDNACKSYIECAKHIRVFKKLPIRIDCDWIKNNIEEWYYDNASCCDYLSEKAEKLLEKLVKEIHKDNQVYRAGASVGYMDLSKEVKECIEDYRGDK